MGKGEWADESIRSYFSKKLSVCISQDPESGQDPDVLESLNSDPEKIPLPFGSVTRWDKRRVND
jgi:hypothetical protein